MLPKTYSSFFSCSKLSATLLAYSDSIISNAMSLKLTYYIVPVSV